MQGSKRASFSRVSVILNVWERDKKITDFNEDEYIKEIEKNRRDLNKVEQDGTYEFYRYK